MQRTKLISDEYYHIFNRGAGKQDIFFEPLDYRRFLTDMTAFNTNDTVWDRRRLEKTGVSPYQKSEPIVSIIAYCLNPNHFHLILRQLTDNGISEFMKKMGIGYAMYINKKYKRSGTLFQGRYKSVHIRTNERLFYLSAYVNCNAQVHGITQAHSYPWSSFSQYIGKENKYAISIDTSPIMQEKTNTSVSWYEKYAVENAIDERKNRRYKKMLFEE